MQSKKSQPKILLRLALFAGLLLFLIHLLSSTVVPSIQKAVNRQNSKFDKKLHSVDDADSLWVVVNKGRKLPNSYEPLSLVVPNVSLRLDKKSPEMTLREEAAINLEKMFAVAKKDDVDLMLASAYRSYQSQVDLHNLYVETEGVKNAEISSAKPGHSEHQTGLGIDLSSASRECEVQLCFANTKEGKWLAKNSYKYGFIIRYQKGKESITGYEYEPWHFRYVGKELANEVKNDGETLEQFFDLPIFTDYPSNSETLKN